MSLRVQLLSIIEHGISEGFVGQNMATIVVVRARFSRCRRLRDRLTDDAVRVRLSERF